MYSLIRSVGVRSLLTDQVPTMTAALVIAELLYKFHSFTLECLAFLLTWGALDLGVQGLRRYLAPPQNREYPRVT